VMLAAVDRQREIAHMQCVVRHGTLRCGGIPIISDRDIILQVVSYDMSLHVGAAPLSSA
jgi:hypothetical protein